ncbi:head maturation protease, ClpP-related [Tissierella praeacuta]|uniref:head maturation protease, ClpP-related n=1 Tax=Tissierella praeacuta TaxID=43131 RepID=UPI003DA50EA6
MPKRIDIKGFIIPQEDIWIYRWLEYPYTTSDIVNKALKDANGEDVEVYINSYGGAVHIGSEIYTSLKDYPGNVLIKIVGLAASAASVIGMAGKSAMSPTAQIMMHNASTGARGDYRVMDKTSEMLQKTNKSILNAYKLKTGLSEEELKAIMDKETWLTAEEAKELGFVDEIMFEDDNKNSNQTAPILYNSVPMPSMKVIEEMRQAGSIEKFKENIAKSKIQSIENIVVDNKLENQEEVEEIMNLEELKEKYPDVYNAAFNDGVKSERERIKAIEDLAIPGNEGIINNAKFETGVTAENVAIEIIKAEKQRGVKFLNNLDEDINNSGLDEIEGGDAPLTGEEKKAKMKNTVNNIANAANARRQDK